MTIPAWSSRWRWLVIAYGVSLLFWLGVEDQQTLTVTFFGVWGAFVGVIGGLWGHYAGQTLTLTLVRIALPLVGAIVGVGASVATVLLMFLKTAWHSHLFPDYPAPMMLAMLQRLPIWALAGALFGLGVLLWYEGHQTR